MFENRLLIYTKALTYKNSGVKCCYYKWLLGTILIFFVTFKPIYFCPLLRLLLLLLPDKDGEENFADDIRITRSDRSLFRKILILIRNSRNEEDGDDEDNSFLYSVTQSQSNRDYLLETHTHSTGGDNISI